MNTKHDMLIRRINMYMKQTVEIYQEILRSSKKDNNSFANSYLEGDLSTGIILHAETKVSPRGFHHYGPNHGYINSVKPYKDIKTAFLNWDPSSVEQNHMRTCVYERTMTITLCNDYTQHSMRCNYCLHVWPDSCCYPVMATHHFYTVDKVILKSRDGLPILS